MRRLIDRMNGELGHVYVHQRDGPRQYALGARLVLRRQNTCTLANVLVFLAWMTVVAGGMILTCWLMIGS